MIDHPSYEDRHTYQEAWGKAPKWEGFESGIDLSHLSNGDNRHRDGGKLILEPFICAFDRAVSEPLKSAMKAVQNIHGNQLQFSHNCKNLTLKVKDGLNADTPTYLVWIAYDLLYGVASVYFNKELLNENEFEDKFLHALRLTYAWQGMGGKGKGQAKGKSNKGELPTVSEFLKSAGLTMHEGKGIEGEQSLSVPRCPDQRNRI